MTGMVRKNISTLRTVLVITGGDSHLLEKVERYRCYLKMQKMLLAVINKILLTILTFKLKNTFGKKS
jgi:hypothetical protein